MGERIEGEHNLIANLELMEGSNDANLIIGNYNRLQHGLRIFLGAEPQINWISTYVFGVCELDVFKRPEPDGCWVRSKGDVVIENDCFIGYGTTIMSGVTIRNGSIIGVNSLVLKSTEPYSIYGGNPAEFIRWRFPEDIREKLLKAAWWNLPIEKIREIQPILLSNNYEKLFEVLNVT